MLVTCNGMPRSASTYQYNLARLVVQTAGMGSAHTYMDFELDKLPGNTWSPALFQEWMRDDAHHVVKMHEVHPVVRDSIRAGNVRTLYIHRDIRDVAVSVKRVRKLTGDRLLETVASVVSLYYDLAALRERDYSAPGHG